jgi:hypothetical protein
MREKSTRVNFRLLDNEIFQASKGPTEEGFPRWLLDAFAGKLCRHISYASIKLLETVGPEPAVSVQLLILFAAARSKS